MEIYHQCPLRVCDVVNIHAWQKLCFKVYLQVYTFCLLNIVFKISDYSLSHIAKNTAANTSFSAAQIPYINIKFHIVYHT